jgi:hypothetical protein
MSTLALLLIQFQGGFKFGDLERFSTTGIDITFVMLPVVETLSINEVLTRFPSRSVQLVAFPFDQVQRGDLFGLSLCKDLIDVSEQD